jgi:hypothetical protein
MKHKSSQVCAVLGLLSGFLSSCGTSGDVINPTISQMDKQDVQWGLPPRQSKGSPRHTNAPQELLNTAPPSSAPAYAPAPAAASPAAAPSAPASTSLSVPGQSSPLSVDPSVIQKLR